jgi:hypothetical protein
LNRSRKVPLGQDLKDLSWRIGAWFVGFLTFVVLLQVFTGGSVSLFQWWQRLLLFLLGVVLSYPYVRDWRRGEVIAAKAVATEPAVVVEGKDSGTYVVLQMGQRFGRTVRPRELNPVPWGLYSVVVRAPVAVGDLVLTYFWRMVGSVFGYGQSGGRWGSSSSSVRPPPDQQGFGE